jgi:hypothetical protein
MDWLEEVHPELVERYGELYARGAYLSAQERARLGELVRPAGRSRPGAPRFERPLRRDDAGERRRSAERAPPSQPSLF